MDSDREILGQLGLMLTQLGRARRALEDIERSTARYGGLSFAPLLSTAQKFGEPPMLAGALRVYVVNINDLAPGGTGIGAFFGNLLGGVGSFVGGLVGGVAGGFVGALALPENLAELAKITASMEKIVALLDAMDRRKGNGKQPDQGPGIADRLPQLTDLVRAFTALLPPLTELVRALADSLPRLVDPIEKLYRLFTSGSEKKEKPEASGPPIQWEKVLMGIHRIVQGLTHLLPLAIGSLAFLLTHLRDVQRVITDLMGWALRLVFLLRGALLVVINDTLAAGARAAVEILAILGAAIERLMSAVFVAFERALLLASDLLRALASGLGNTLTKLLQWVVTNVFEILTELGKLKVFQAVVQVTGTAGDFLRLLQHLLAGKGLISPMAAPPIKVSKSTVATGPPVVKPPKITGPDLAEAVAPLAQVAKLGFELSSTAASVFTEIKGALKDAREALRMVGDAAARRSREGAFASGPLQQALGQVRANAKDLGKALEEARKSPGPKVSDELDMVAKAYETWLEKGGMESLLVGFTRQFLKSPTSGAGVGDSVPGKIVADAAEAVRAEQRADVEIGELVIEIEPPEPGRGEGQAPIFSRDWLEDMLEEIHLDRSLRDPFYSGSPI